MKRCTIYEPVPGNVFWYDESDMHEKLDRLLIYRNEHVYGFLTRDCETNMIFKEISIRHCFFMEKHRFIVGY